MSRSAPVVPSHARAVLRRLYPQVDQGGWNPALNAHNAPQVGALLSVLDLIPEKHFAALDPADDLLLTVAMGTLRSYVEIWKHTDSAEKRVHGGAPMQRDAALQNRHPIEVVDSVLGICPDVVPDPGVHDLAFVADPPLAAALREDMSTAIRSLSNHDFKAACVMGGSVIEALLLWATKRVEARHGRPSLDAALAAWRAEFLALPAVVRPQVPNPPGALEARWDKWNLVTLIGIAPFTPTPMLSRGAADAANSAREFRNLIHPERANATPPTMGTTQITIGAMNRVAEELEARVNDGTL